MVPAEERYVGRSLGHHSSGLFKNKKIKGFAPSNPGCYLQTHVEQHLHMCLCKWSDLKQMLPPAAGLVSVSRRASQGRRLLSLSQTLWTFPQLRGEEKNNNKKNK